MSSTSKITTIEELRTEIERRILATEHLLQISRAIFGQEHIGDTAEIATLIDQCRMALKSPTPVSVALLGGTGAGKSTLVNAILGSVVLPTNSISVCTSSITRVRYRSGNSYHASIEIVPTSTWDKQVQDAAEDVKASLNGDDVDVKYSNINVIPDDEAARIRAIYGDKQFEEFSRLGNYQILSPPVEIREAFRIGTIELKFDNTEDLRKGISKYLTSKDNFWPIVKSVVIEGPFLALNHGGELVDLPGLNDPNEAREALTKSFLETAKFVWVVFNMKRSVGKELTQVLESRDLLNRLLAGGRIQTLTFVGTHSDDVGTIDSEQFGLDEDSSNSDIALKRNELAEDELRINLKNISRSVATTDGDTAETKAIVDSLVKSPAFMVSASNFLQLDGASKSRVQVIFQDKNETNIPQLRNHMKQLCVEAGPKADAYTLVSTLEEAVAELAVLAREIETENALRLSTGKLAQRNLATGVATAGAALSDNIEKVISNLRRSLQQAVERFEKGSALDKNAVSRVIAKTTSQWSSMHWATLRATSSRGGRYTSPSRGDIDLIRQLSEPVIHHSMVPWTEFFGKDLPAITNETNNGLGDVVTKYVDSLSTYGDANDEIGQLLNASLPELMGDVTESVEAALAVVQKTIESDITIRRQELHGITDAAISSSMAAVFSRAAAERGTGMKSRMNDHLESGSRNAVDKACDLVQSNLAISARQAIDGVLAEITPAADKINQKSLRLSKRLAELSDKRQVVSDTDIQNLLKSVDAAKKVVSCPLIFETGVLASAARSIEHSPIAHTSITVHGSPNQIFVDASNVARSPGAPPNISHLENCRLALVDEFDGRAIVLIADASLPTIVNNESSVEDKSLMKSMISDGRIVIVPPGTPGKADKFILGLASSNGGTVISNDSFREFQNDNQWLFEDGRLRGHAHGGTIGWYFPIRFPVRQRNVKS